MKMKLGSQHYGVGLLILALLLGMGSLLLSRERVYKFRQTLYVRQKQDQLEVCDAVKRNPVATSRGQAPFQEWAQQVRYAQQKSSPDKALKPRIETEGTECNLRHAGESWFHYKSRKVREKLHDYHSRMDEGFSQFTVRAASRWLGELQARISGKMLDREESFAHQQVSPFQKGFHTVWMDFPAPLALTPAEFSEFALEAQGLVAGKELDQSVGAWVETLSDQFFGSSIPEVGIIKASRPKLQTAISPLICRDLLSDPATTSETSQVHRHLQIAKEACKKRPSPLCDPKRFARASTFVCVLSAPVGSALLLERKALNWSEVLNVPLLELGILHIPQDFLNVENSRRNARVLRLAYDFARVLDPAFIYRPSDDETPKDPQIAAASLALLEGPGFGLTRMGALNFFSPFSDGPLTVRLEPYSSYYNFREKMQDLIQQFRVAYIAHKGAL